MQHRQGVRDEEDGAEPVLEGDLGVQQHRQEHAEEIRADGDQDRDENREQVGMAHARILEHGEVVLESNELEIAISLRIRERVHRSLKEREVQEYAHQDRSRNRHPIKRRIDLALGELRDLFLRRLSSGLCSSIDTHGSSLPHLKFLASILSYSLCMLLRNLSLLPVWISVCRKPAILMLAGT